MLDLVEPPHERASTMSTRPRIPWDTTRFALADAIARRVADDREVNVATREAVTALTTSADPDRADRLAVRDGEPGPLVERLAVWALHHATDEAVVAAATILDGDREPVHADRTAAMAPAAAGMRPVGELATC
jgi:hypothetical protein